MLGPSPVSKPVEEPTRVRNLVNMVKNDMNQEDLIQSFKAITDNIKKTGTKRSGVKSGVKSGSSNNTDAVPPTKSSKPTGSKWTMDALSKNIMAALNISPASSAALKDILGLPIKHQLTLLNAISERILSKNAPVNDRNNTFESVMNILGNLGPEDNDLVFLVTQPLIEAFHNDIPKPFNNYVGHQYRTADGSSNSLLFPQVGQAGSNYTRSVSSVTENNTNLPSPKLVFDRLLKRPDGHFEEHKGGINMMLFYLAIIITHDLFYTDSKDPKRNMTTGYLDLSSLYGYNRADQESVRQMKDGLLNNDQWFDKRLVIQPAGVAALITVFSRNHNHIAKKLLEINENERFSYGAGKRLASAEEQDEELFQTARLINNGCYTNVIIHDYIRTIIGTNADSDFVFDPFGMPSNPMYGNAVSIEFNAIYRWHAAIGKEDSQWIADVMQLLTEQMKASRAEERHPGLDRSLINKGAQNGSIFDQLLVGFNEHFVHASPEELEKGLPIAGAHRDIDTGKFADTDIIKALKAGFNQSASELGNGQNTPAALEHVEIAGIQQARILNTCYFNDFRKFLHLTTLDTFEDFSEKKEIQEALKELYGTPDRVELYAGLMVERTKQTGLRLPYTMGRAILSDAVNLLRNDRILSKELTPSNLTNWGYQYTLGDPKMHNRVFPFLLTELFPDADTESGGFTADELKTLFNTPKK
ncbi:heme peroxidase [Thamnidium elegans]|nr:heme peroxidase [Thamnidium elegans]